MVYNTNTLETVAQCDALIQVLNVDLTDLNADLAEVQVAITTNTTIASVIPSQLAGVEAELAARQAELAAATTLEAQRSLGLQINTLENRQIRLQMRQDSLAGAGLLDKQHRQARIEAEIGAIEEFKTAIEARKTALESSASAA